MDPEEIDAHAEDIKEMIIGCCFMMSARNIIVAIDLSNVTAKEASGLCNGQFNRMTRVKLLYDTLTPDADRASFKNRCCACTDMLKYCSFQSGKAQNIKVAEQNCRHVLHNYSDKCPNWHQHHCKHHAKVRVVQRCFTEKAHS